MCDPAVDTPFITFKGGNCNLIQIYLNSENSTGDSVQSCFENSEVKFGLLFFFIAKQKEIVTQKKHKKK